MTGSREEWAASEYLALTVRIRQRFDLIAATRSAPVPKQPQTETVALQGRNIVEGLAFGCLVAVDHALKEVPRDARGQWRADTILKSLKTKGLESAYPSPSRIRPPEGPAEAGVKAVIAGIPEARVSIDEMIAIYGRFHRWLHELNPHVHEAQEAFVTANEPSLWRDVERLDRFLRSHVVSIRGKGFFCVVRDSVDGRTRVVPIAKVAM